LLSGGLPAEFVLFGEDASRVVVSCDLNSLPRIQQVALKYSIVCEQIGETTSDHIEIRIDGRAAVSATVSELREVYENALEETLKTDAGLVAAN